MRHQPTVVLSVAHTIVKRLSGFVRQVIVRLCHRKDIVDTSVIEKISMTEAHDWLCVSYTKRDRELLTA